MIGLAYKSVPNELLGRSGTSVIQIYEALNSCCSFVPCCSTNPARSCLLHKCVLHCARLSAVPKHVCPVASIQRRHHQRSALRTRYADIRKIAPCQKEMKRFHSNTEIGCFARVTKGKDMDDEKKILREFKEHIERIRGEIIRVVAVKEKS